MHLLSSMHLLTYQVIFLSVESVIKVSLQPKHRLCLVLKRLCMKLPLSRNRIFI